MSSTYLTATEKAAKIRATYKRLGWTSRDVSVRARTFSMGEDVRVEIKSPRVDYLQAKKIAEGEEEIARDQFGEILSGGNTYVNVSLSREVGLHIVHKYLDILNKAAEKLDPKDPNMLALIEGLPGKWWLGLQDYGRGFKLWRDDSFVCGRMDLEGIALEIGTEGGNPCIS